MKDNNKQVTHSLVLVLQFGINVIVPIMMCTMLGVLLANHFNSKGFSIGGILLGIVAGFNGAFRMVKGYLKNPESPGQRARRLEEEEKNSHNENDN